MNLHAFPAMALTASLLLMSGCSAPKFTHPNKVTRPVSVSLPTLFSGNDSNQIEQQLLPCLGRWPRGTTISISIQSVTQDPKSNMKTTWSDSIGNGTQNGWEAGSAVGEAVDFLSLNHGFFRVTVGAVGFIIGGTAGAIAGPFTQVNLDHEARESSKFNFIAGIRIQSPKAAPTNIVLFDIKNYPIKPPADKSKCSQVQHESLGLLVSALKEHLETRSVLATD